MRRVDLQSALRQLLAHRLRAALALLGIYLGTSSFVLLVGLLRGGQAALSNAAQEASEKDMIVVRKEEPPPNQTLRTSRTLSRRDATAISLSRSLGDPFVSAEQRHSTTAHHHGKTKRVTVVSASPATPEVYRLKVALGRFLNTEDLERFERVCVIGHEVWEELLRGSAGIGSRLIIDQTPCVVIGVLERKAIMGGTSDTDIWNRKVLLPETTFDTLYNPRRNADKVILRPRAAADTDAARAIARSLLLRLHDGVENFKLNPAQDARQERLIAGILYVLLFGAVFVSLTVGGINVMNVLLVSVTERTREIGIRRALGATPSAIRWQFLSEALVLTGIGGTLGVCGGAAACAASALVLRRIVGTWELSIAPWSIALGIGLSVIVGLVSGTYPAARASRLLITEALRRE